VDTYAKQSLLEGDVNGAAGGSRVEKSVGHGHKYEKQHIYIEIEKESFSNSGIQFIEHKQNRNTTRVDCVAACEHILRSTSSALMVRQLFPFSQQQRRHRFRRR